MGVGQSIERSTGLKNTYSLKELEKNVNNLGGYSLVKDIDNYNSPDKLKFDISKSIDLFKDTFNKNMEMCNHYINLNNLQYNYKTKNQFILDDLKKKIDDQNILIKSEKGDAFKDIEISNNYRSYIRKNKSNKKILLIFIFVIVVLFLSVLALFGKRKLDTGSFTNKIVNN